VCVTAYAVLGLVQIIADFGGPGGVLGVDIVVMMPLLAAFLLVSVPRSRMRSLVLVGLGFSWLGDAVGFLLLLKIGLFLAAQIAYAAAFWPHRQRSLLVRPAPLLLYALLMGTTIALLATHADSLGVPVVVYGVSVALMAALATGVSGLVGVGGFLFLMSDIVLGCYFFLGADVVPHSLAVNSLLYFPGQLLIVWGTVRHLIAEAQHPEARVAVVGG
jgi:uncharacterized membrane protein YhhN